MIIEDHNFADFEATVPVQIAETILDLLQDDAPLKRWAKGGIVPVEIDDLRLEGSFDTPALLVAIGGIDLVGIVGDDFDLGTTLELHLVTNMRTSSMQDQWLRQRVVDHIRKLILAQDNGCLTDADGQPLTEALVSFQRLTQPLKLPGNQLSTRVEVTFSSRVDRQLRFIG